MISGAEVFLEMLAGCGVRRIFGNPGTTELPLNDAVAADPRFEYLLALQEVPVMAMADGHALASGQLTVVNLHAACGLGSSMGVLYNAWREGTPLLVTAGQQDRRLLFEEPILGGPLAEIVRPWTKWSFEVQRLADLPGAVRRAAQTALTPPTGPVFLSLPIDLLLETADPATLDLRPARLPDPRLAASAEALEDAASVLLAGRRVAVLAGSRIVERDACQPLTDLAELLGAPVFAESTTSHGRLPIASDHPLYQGTLPLWSPEVQELLRPFDVLLVAGMDLLRQYVHFEPPAIPPATQIVQLDEDQWQIGKNYPVRAGLLGDTRSNLQRLGRLIAERRDPQHEAAAAKRIAQLRQRRQAEATQLRRAAAESKPAGQAMSPGQLMLAVADAIEQHGNVAVVEEAVTTSNHQLEKLGVLRDPQAYFGHRGWTLGWGLGCAIGVQLAWPQRRVLGLIGDGAAMYGIQALWSAARYRIPAVILICNNSQYKILKDGARMMQLPQATAEHFTGMDLDQPAIDYVGLAQSLGVAGCRAADPQQLGRHLADALADESQPRLIEAPIGE